MQTRALGAPALSNLKNSFLRKMDLTLADIEVDHIKERNAKSMKLCIEIEIIKNFYQTCKGVSKEDVEYAVASVIIFCKYFKFTNNNTVLKIVKELFSSKTLNLMTNG